MKKVAILITLPELGGAQSHVFQILNAIDRTRFEPVLLTAGHGWLTERAAELGIRFYPLKHLRRSIHPGADGLALLEIMDILRRERPDVLHLHSSKAGILGRLAGKLSGIPRVVFTAHGFSFHARLKPLQLLGAVWLEKLLVPLLDAIIPVSTFDHERALKFKLCSPSKLHTIRNGIDTSPRFERGAARARMGAAEDSLLIGMVARFAFPKDHDLLLRAARDLLRSDPRLRLILIGSGPEQPHIERLAQVLEIRDRIDFLGDRNDVPELLPGLDLFVLASRFEALPMTIIEAMAAGLPVVSSDVGGVGELVLDGMTGLRVPPDDEGALREALRALASDPALRASYGEAGRERARQEFDRTLMMRRIEAVYHGEGVWEPMAMNGGVRQR